MVLKKEEDLLEMTVADAFQVEALVASFPVVVLRVEEGQEDEQAVALTEEHLAGQVEDRLFQVEGLK